VAPPELAHAGQAGLADAGAGCRPRQGRLAVPTASHESRRLLFSPQSIVFPAVLKGPGLRGRNAQKKTPVTKPRNRAPGHLCFSKKAGGRHAVLPPQPCEHLAGGLLAWPAAA